VPAASDPAHPGSITEWCEVHLGAAPVHSFIADPPASQLWGFELEDGRVVAVKVRPRSARLEACVAAHSVAAGAGIGCPVPLAGPAPMGEDLDLVVTAETWRADGAVWPNDDPPGSYGRLLARVVRALSGVDPAPLVPPPPWLRYDHRAAGRLWAPVTDGGRDPESLLYELPAGLTGHAASARERLLAADLPAVAGHPDLNGMHVRWLDGPNGVPLAIVHAWDELTARPEAVLVGCLAANYYELPEEPRLAPVVQGERVLAAYQAESGRSLTEDEVQVAWAASVWVACYTAALEHANGAPGQVTHQIMTDAALRLHLAGC
jgi:hypothetical protein